jgi:hypothetical protein
MRSALASMLAVGAVISAAAQTPVPAAQPAAPPDGSTVTVTGCLSKPDASDVFVLNKVRWDSTAAADGNQGGHHDQKPAAPPRLTTPSTPSTAPAPSAAKETADESLQRATTAASAERLRLAGDAKRLKLADHAGHTITATGMLGPPDPTVSPAVVLPDRPAGDKPAPANSSGAGMRVLNVRSITHVAAECK